MRCPYPRIDSPSPLHGEGAGGEVPAPFLTNPTTNAMNTHPTEAGIPGPHSIPQKE